MVIPSKPKSTSKLKYAYLAGFIDGEGSFTLQHYKDKKGHSKGVYAIIQLCNTNYEVMVFAKELMEKIARGKISFFCSETTSVQKKKIWRIKTKKKDYVRRILIRMCPLLIVKKRQAEIILKYLDKGMYAKVKNYGVDQALHPDIQWMISEIKRLNRCVKRGCVTTNTQNILKKE